MTTWILRLGKIELCAVPTYFYVRSFPSFALDSCCFRQRVAESNARLQGYWCSLGGGASVVWQLCVYHSKIRQVPRYSRMQ